MAKTVKPIAIELGIKGGEQLGKLNSAFRELAKTVNQSDKIIEDARKGVIEYGKSAGSSTALIKGQISAFKGLKEQATIGSTVYKKLGKDIDELTASLDRLYKKEAEGAKKPRTAKQIFSEGVAVVPEKFARQIAAGNQILQTLKVTSAEYGQQLANITVRTQEYNRAQERQQVVAQNLIATNRAQSTGFLQSNKVNLEGTKTVAALRLKISELTQDLENVTINSRDYQAISSSLTEAQRELNEVLNQSTRAFKALDEAQVRAERRAKKLEARRQYEGGKGLIGGRDPATGALIAGGTGSLLPPKVPAQIREISSLYGNIADIGLAKVTAGIEMMGKSYKEVSQDIRNATAASNNSISSLNNQRASWIALRNQLDPTSKDFREVTREIEKVDRALEKSNRRRRKFSAGAAAQTAGAAISGGIFGGPEGFIGGVAGGIIGGPGGAFAGAAIGAQVAQLRQAAGEVGAYVAELNLAKATLAGVSKDQLEYNQNLEFAREISGKYALRIKDVIQSFAGVTAAAKANNLTVKETQQVFEGITASGIAFGKSQEDLQALFLATVQVLSKGKASAEEISGQIGERIPGAVAKFAAATDRSLPELAKAFQKGEVTIADFVKFTQAQGEEYAEFAESLASGPEKAGLRLQIALDTAGENFGTFFQKTGSGIQDFFKLIVDFANNNQEVVKGIVADVYIAGQQVLEIFKDIAKGINTIIGPAIRGVVDFFNKGVNTIYAGFRRNKELQAGGFDPAAADKFAADSAENVTSSFERIFGLPRYQKRYKEAYAIFVKEALAEGRKVLGSGVETNRQAVIDKLFGEFKPSRFSGTVLGSGGGNGGGNGNGGGGGTRSKDISALKLEAEITKIIAGRREDDFELRRKSLQLAREAAVKASEQLEPNRQLLAILKASEAYRRGILQLEKDIAAEEKKQTEEANKRARADFEKRFGFKPDFGDKRNVFSILGDQQFDPSAERLLPDDSARGIVSDKISTLKEELKELTNIGNQVSGIADQIGSSFTKAFTDVITGSATTQEALAGFFQNISNYFLEMAAKIIQKMITMAILNAVVGLLPGSGGGGGGGGGGTGFFGGGGGALDFSNDFAAGFDVKFAKGGAFDKQGIMPFAMGGIVKKPTLFKYADGGAGRFGLMGEAGAEAILPLRRNASGRLGVEASGGGVTVGAINITVENTGDQLNPAAQKQIAGQVQGLVLSTLANERRSGGMLG